MGEMKEGAKKEGEKKDDGNAAVVLKMDMHCDGCAKKVRRAVRKIHGVEDVKVDSAGNKLTVTGKVDPTKIKEKLEEKTRKKVEIVSPQPKKDGGGGDKKPEEKPEKKTEEKKTEEKKAEDKKPKEMTVVFRIRTHCDGCIKKIHKIISNTKGVSAVSIDGAKDLVTVTGTVDPKELTPQLKDKLKRSVEVVPPPAAKKDDGAAKKEKEGGGEKKNKEAGGGGEKKEKEAAGGDEKKKDGGEKKDKGESKKEDGGGTEAPKMEASKLQYPGYSAAPSMYWQEGPSYTQSSDHNYPHNYAYNYPHSYAMEPYNYHPGYANPGYPTHPGYANPGYPTHYVNEGYGMPMDQRLHPMDPRLNPPQMFSDENPNACSLM